VLLNKPNQSNIVCMNIFEDLYQHDSIPSWTLHFCIDQISRKGSVIHNLNPDLFFTFLSPFLSPIISRETHLSYVLWYVFLPALRAMKEKKRQFEKISCGEIQTEFLYYTI
jgi:hypothetical protein